MIFIFLNTFAAIYKLTKFTKLTNCQGEGILRYFLDTTHDNCAILRNVMNERITAWINASLDSSKSNSTSFTTLYDDNLIFLKTTFVLDGWTSQNLMPHSLSWQRYFPTILIGT